MRRRVLGLPLLIWGLVAAGIMAIGLISWGYADPVAAALDTDATSEAADYYAEPGSAASAAESELVAGGDGQPRYLDENDCLSCHGDPSLVKKLVDGTSISVYVDTEELPRAVHRFLDCTTCHTSDPHEVDSPLTKLSQAEKCGSCHEYQYAEHKTSVHGALVSGGNSDPATCADCHSADADPHSVVRVLDPSASTYRRNIAETCARCHSDPALMDKYGLVEKVYDSYMDSFHGKAMQLSPDSATLEQLDVATCTNCHGWHNIKSPDDPDSPVAGMEHLLQTCQLPQCHPQAGPEFVRGFLGHRVASAEYLPEVYWGGRAFYVLSRAILAGGVLIVVTSTGIRLVPWIRRKRKLRKNKEE